MRSTQLKILEVSQEGCTFGYIDPNRIAVEGKIALHDSNADNDIKQTAEALVRSVNMVPRLLKALRDTQVALNEAMALCEVLAGYNTRRLAAASDQATFAIEEAQRLIDEWFTD